MIDGSSGETRAVIDETAILLLGELPDGWSEWYRQDLTTVSEIGVRGNDSGAFVITSLEDGSRTFVFEHGERHHRVTLQADIDDDVALRFIDGLS